MLKKELQARVAHQEQAIADLTDKLHDLYRALGINVLPRAGWRMVNDPHPKGPMHELALDAIKALKGPES